MKNKDIYSDCSKRNMMSALALGLWCAALVLASPVLADDGIPLLEEDRPVDFHLVADGPWDGSWVLVSSERDGVDKVTYFCSDFRSETCHGREVIVEGSSPAAALASGECKGNCEGTAKVKRSEIDEGCSNDSDCTQLERACNEARGEAGQNASKECAKAGGEGCACFAATKVTKTKTRCKSGFLAKYCKYTCSAKAEGTCGKAP